MATPKWPFVQKVGGKWRGYYRVGDKRRFLPLRASAEEASKEAIEMRKQVREGGPLVALTVGNLADRFLEDVRRTRTHGTWDFYTVQLAGVFRAWRRDTLVACITAEDLRHLIDAHAVGKFSSQTIQHRRAVLRRMFRWGIKGGLVRSDPTTLVEWPTPEQSTFDAIPSDVMASHLDRLRSECEPDYDLVVVSLYTGLRRAEFARLRVKDIDLAAGVLWVRGKRRSQYVPVVEQIRESVERMIARAGDREFLLPESAFDRGVKKDEKEPPKLTPAELAARARGYTVANTFRRWSVKLGDKRFHPHAMRHTLATELVRSGVERGTVGQMLRHRQVSTTERYVHMVRDDLKRAMAKLDIRTKPHA